MTAPPSDPTESVVSSTSKSFLDCQKLISIIICLIIIIIYTQFIFFYFSSNENYIKQPIFTKYVTNSSLVLCIFIAIPLWRFGTQKILLQRMSINPDNVGPITTSPITPLASVEDAQGGGLLGISEHKTDFLTIDDSIKVLFNNNKSRTTLCQRYRVPTRDWYQQFKSMIKFGILFGVIGLTTGILWIELQNHHTNDTNTTIILLDECIFFLVTLIIVLLHSYKQQTYPFHSVFITSIVVLCVGVLCVMIYYIYTQLSSNSNTKTIFGYKDIALSVICGFLFGIFMSSIDYVSKKRFYFHNVLILFGDVLFMIGLYGLIVLIFLWPSLLAADALNYEHLSNIPNTQWIDISISIIIDFIFNISLFLCIALGNALFVALNCIICLILEITMDIVTNHQDILWFKNKNDHISNIDNDTIYDNITSFKWNDWKGDILLVGLSLLIIGIISLNTLIIRYKEFSRLYCYQSCYYCCSHTRYYQFQQRNQYGFALKCHNCCCKCIWWSFCFPCCVKCCCCKHGNKYNVQYIQRKERLFYQYGDDIDKNIGGGSTFFPDNSNDNNGCCNDYCCCVCIWGSNKYDIVEVNPVDTKHLSKNLVNELTI